MEGLRLQSYLCIPSSLAKELRLLLLKSMFGDNYYSSKKQSYGFEYDRNWMVVRKPEDESGEYRFVTQRQFPKMVLISPQFVKRGESTFLVLSAPSMKDIEVVKYISLLTQKR